MRPKINVSFKIGVSISILSLAVFSSPAKAEISTPQVYVALGDSVAAGATPYESLDAGYADIIADTLAQNGLLAAFSKDFAVPGFAVSDIHELLDEEEIRQTVSQASLITLSAGANNILGLVRQDAAGRTVIYDQLTANYTLNQMRIQYGDLLDEIQDINPEASIYAMGYYFPYPHVLEAQQEGVRKMLDLVNRIIENEASKRNIEFVDAGADFDEFGMEYLPNPVDVHPNQQGYLSMANSFFSVAEPALKAANGNIPPNPGMSPFLESLMPPEQTEEETAGDQSEESIQDGSEEEEEVPQNGAPDPSGDGTVDTPTTTEEPTVQINQLISPVLASTLQHFSVLKS
ncbi:GDSL-type esterase/lipase family protein [Jeotgalibacillus sp. ET6]|uniref:SGNH/GDSL hydrolase family protein n=1 Tax=Jeotgalibacillus sp. ET6 TaxID=3037260 RepID=UPI0024186F40|nr:GDSL-type esterase/lipase family protein [Jeotgalibacillus sp. ET6]MDG5470424.1 GDSL-type esterase/lipase family protein [Jeotgalibacillus sp. ET6]